MGHPKANAARPRVAVITQGAKSTIVVDGAKPEEHKVYSVTPVTSELIVDTNGAGDAFAGGFLGAYVSGRCLEESVDVGHKLGAMCVQLVCMPMSIGHSAGLTLKIVFLSCLVGWSTVQVAQGRGALKPLIPRR